MRQTPVRLAVGLCFIGFIFVIGCGLMGCSKATAPEATTNAAPTTPQSATTAPATAPTDGGSALTGDEIAAAMQKATSFRRITKMGGSEIISDIVCPDKKHEISKQGRSTDESIYIGQAEYTKVSGGKWMQMPTRPSPYACSQDAAFDASGTMTKGAAETINGESCTHWTTVSSKGATAGQPWDLCIGSDKLPRQIKFEGMTMIFSGWNKPITVEPPKI